MDASGRLSTLATFYHREAKRCEGARAYLAACVMQASALEAALQAMCFLYPASIRKTVAYKRKRFKKRRNKALEFSLYELINIADELGWFPSKKANWAGKRATLAGFSHEVRKLRNFVHPGVWGRTQPSTMKFTKGVYDAVFEVFDVATTWLLHRVHQSLRQSVAKAHL